MSLGFSQSPFCQENLSPPRRSGKLKGMARFSLNRLLLTVMFLCLTLGYAFAEFRANENGSGDEVTGVWMIARIVVFGSCGVGLSAGVLFGRWWVGAIVAAVTFFLAFALC
jgi:hypothetical protein